MKLYDVLGWDQGGKLQYVVSNLRTIAEADAAKAEALSMPKVSEAKVVEVMPRLQGNGRWR